MNICCLNDTLNMTQESEKEYVCVYIYKTESLCCKPEINITLQVNYTPIKFLKTKI